jgi:Asp-tRNA(Asn)/Glu-tRNA(Gln) amidotransferase A subunit family amidase
MSEQKSRRKFVAEASMMVLGAAGLGGSASAETPPKQNTPGAPPAFGTAPAAGPEVSTATFEEAEKLVQAPMTGKDRAQAAGNWRQAMAGLTERRTGPQKVAIEATVAPYSTWNPVLQGQSAGPARDVFVRTAGEVPPLPATDAEIAFAPVSVQARWIETRKITSERLTKIYLARIEGYNPTLRCVITATPELALSQARAADEAIASGHYRGPLQGIPWGGKDLIDTAGTRTTYGADFYEHRVPTEDAAVVARLHAAGAVLVAKLSMGALALNDVWFGGQTMNPWLLDEGSSGSSAGPGSATAAGLVGFSIGSETGGSIISPSMRCGITGLRPTFGRVPRSGAMTLCWSLDKLGPMTRTVEDAMLVLQAIHGPDAGDLTSVAAKLDYDATTPVTGLRVGYFPAWMQQAPATDVDRDALATIAKLGMTTVPVTLPDWPYSSLNTILFAESAAAFEEQTLDHRVDQLKAQVPDAWPNTFRQSRFLSAVDFVQADRLRRKVAWEMARVMGEVDLLLVPSLRDEMLTISNNTGHPSLTLKTGYVEVAETEYSSRKLAAPRRVPHGVTLIGRLYEEGTIARVGLALERHYGVAGEHPAGFAG